MNFLTAYSPYLLLLLVLPMIAMLVWQLRVVVREVVRGVVRKVQKKLSYKLSQKLPPEQANDITIAAIDALLPQTQCGHCGYPGCRPYAQAIAEGRAINLCPPGGASTIKALAALLHAEVIPLDSTHGTESERKVAFIREAECIGCTKCIAACPVDAILGSGKHMHTVITAECTGCDLCVEPCPVDCIDMIVALTPLQGWHWQRPQSLPLHLHLISNNRQGQSGR